MRTQLDYEAAVSLLAKVAHATSRVRPGEVKAAVTHWLQSQGETPPYCDEQLVEGWRTALLTLPGQDARQPHRNHDEYSPLGTSFRVASIPFLPPARAGFTFSDMFAGIGGFRLALQELGGRCVFACEWDKPAKITYYRNFGIVPYGDIKQFTGQDITDDELDRLIPYHDIMAAGFPCQPFSLAGMPARNHYKIETGLASSQGAAFFDLVRVARVKRPRALFLENVMHILSMDRGMTFSTIRRYIEQELGYEFHHRVIDASTLVPQRRKRLYIVALKEPGSGFEFPELSGDSLPLSSVLQEEVPDRYTISDRLWSSHILRSERNRERGTGFAVKLAALDRPSPTIVARYGKDGKECLIPQRVGNPRKLTPLECARLQGFPDSFICAGSDTASYRQFGNAVPVPVIDRIARNIIQALNDRTPTGVLLEMTPPIHKRHVDYFRRLVLSWGRKNFKGFPWRCSPNLWHRLVAEIMLQRTRADQVLPVYVTFAATYQVPEEFVAAPTCVFSRLGLPIRDEQFIALNHTLVGEGLPSDKAALMRLPGVGDYIASAFVSLHLGKRAALIDANTVRLYGRFFGFDTDPETRRKRWFVELADQVTPWRVFKDYNYAIIDFSREICTPRNPQHAICPLRLKCRYLQTAGDRSC